MVTRADLLLNEADTCRKYVVPRLTQAGWDDEPHSFTEQRSFTDGRIVVVGDKPRRRKQKRADYLLRYARDFMIAVVIISKLDALQRHQAQTAASPQASAVLERAFRGEL